MTVYFISGLGADSTIFKHIQLPPHCRMVHLDWVTPLKKETLVQYATRLAESIDTSKPFALVGLSFGGMLAIEIAKIKTPAVVILISSIPTTQHLPHYFRAAGRLGLHNVVPVGLIQQASVLKRLFTIETREDKKMLKAMIRKSDAEFIKWAMHAVLTWQNSVIPQQLVHIHGTRDAILPHRFTKPTHAIPKGGHLLVLNRAAEVNKILQEVFTNMGF